MTKRKQNEQMQVKLMDDDITSKKERLEDMLYKLYNGNKKPPTLELIGTGNRCIPNEEGDDEDKTDELNENLNKYEKIIKKISNEEEKILYQQNLIRTLDPNVYSNAKILKTYLKNKNINNIDLFNQFKKEYNTHNHDDNIMEDLYKYYFPKFFFISKKSNSFLSNSSSSSGSYDSNKKTLPSVPQSIVNNICKMITKNILDKKGMLLWHSTGSGKTCTASAIMDGFWKSNKKIIYCSSIDALASNPPFKFHECCINLFKRFEGKSLNDLNREFKNRKVEFLSFAKLSNRLVKKVINLNDCVLILK